MRFEYKVYDYTKNQTGLEFLNQDGNKGWEIIFLIKETTSKYTFLLKRRIE